MTSPTATSPQSHNSRTRLMRAPSGPRPLSSASSRSSSSQGGTLSRQSSIKSISEDEETPTQERYHLRADPPHTRHISMSTTTSRYSTYSEATTTLPHIDGLGFDMMSEQFEALMEELDRANVPVTSVRPGMASAAISRTPTQASRTSSRSTVTRQASNPKRRSPLAPPELPPMPEPEPVPAVVAALPVISIVTATPTVESTPFVKGHTRRSSSISSTSTLAPETPADDISVSAFPQPPAIATVDTPPALPVQARLFVNSYAVPDEMKVPQDSKHVSWSGSELYVDCTKVARGRSLQPDLEKQVLAVETQLKDGFVASNRTDRRLSVATRIVQFTIPLIVLAIAGVVVWVIIRYR